MDLGAVTLVVAITFAGIGIFMGILISRLLSKREEHQPDFLKVEEKVDGLVDRLNHLAEEISGRLKEIRQGNVEELKQEVSGLLSEIERLKRELHQLDLSKNSISLLDDTENRLREIEFNLPRIDESLLTQIKDNLIILRNDVTNLLLKMKEKESKPVPAFDPSLLEPAVDSLNTAIELSKKLNALLVKGELTALAASFKNEDLSSFVKELDDQAINSKELVVLLEDAKKKLEEVRNEASLRR